MGRTVGVTNGAGGLAMRFCVLDIWADGYERVAHIRSINSGAEFFASFIEHDEYIDSGKSIKRTAGTQIEGNLQIEFVNDFSSSNENLFYCQATPQSPSIQAVVDVIEVIDDFSIRANLILISNQKLYFFQSNENRNPLVALDSIVLMAWLKLKFLG